MMNAPTHSRVTRAAEGLPRRRFTVAEVEAMVAAGVMEEDERLELIGGELVRCRPKATSMSSQSRTPRALVPHPTRRLQTDSGKQHSGSPRTLIWNRRRHLSSRCGTKGLSGSSALLVVEIADASLRTIWPQSHALRELGVRELWVIDAVKRTGARLSRPLRKGYSETADFSASDRLAPLVAPDAFALRLDELETD